MYDAGKWLEETGKNPNQWWQTKNLNRQFLQNYIEPDEFYVALIDGKPATSVILQTNQRNQDWSSVDKGNSPEALYIHWLSVKREFAGKNLPKVMVDFAKKKAQEKNIKLLRLDTDANEVKLMNLYKKLGFKLVGTTMEDSFKVAFFQKKLD